MALNKKGIFFTTLVILILLLFVLTITLYSGIRERKDAQQRVTTLNNFIFSSEKDLERQMYISSFRIIFILDKKIVERGTYISNLNESFNELFFSGTFEGASDSELESLMTGIKFSDMNDLLIQKASKIGAEPVFDSTSVNLSQEDPWRVKVTLRTNLFLKDSANKVSWNKSEEISTFIPIEGFEDPFYTVEKGISKKINKTDYVVSPASPSFLEKLEGRTTPNPLYGINATG